MGTKNNSAGTIHTPRGVVQGNVLVAHETGLPIDSVVDNGGIRRLAVDANVDIQNATINVDLDSSTDSVAIRNSANPFSELFIQTDGSITVRIVDEAGTAFSLANPLPVEISNPDFEIDAADGDNIAISGHPTQVFVDNEVGVTTDASFTTILTYTAVQDDTNIVQAEVSGPVAAIARMTLNGSVIRVKRISAHERAVEFRFYEPRRISNTDIIRVEVRPEKAIPGFMTSADFFASLQGFLE